MYALSGDTGVCMPLVGTLGMPLVGTLGYVLSGDTGACL